uniref:Small ribosomal subunit protein uS3c n=1 Tax=Climaconeis cf. scalaris TaxID=2846828 RepID=A0A8F8SPD3_9STRA|nr:ribosomal protein S3 [Climaconeis cf. scalaris]QYB19169.1 ribosomal protein S3 [Climaconeis cf. scalaris]
MGQKTHPLGFRLGITENHKSIWYFNFHKYSSILKEDNLIRTYLNNISKLNGISNVQINRNGSNDQIELIIETAKPSILIGKDGSNLKKLIKDLKKILAENRDIKISIIEVEKIEFRASLLADSIVNKLEKRIAFRKVIRDTLKETQKENINGIKIQISGRLNGAEMARSEWIQEGRVPLQTLRADIDYSIKEANTIYGVLGIKIWLFKNEILSK